MTIQRTLLLSLRPRFANAILSGGKTTEIRRRPVNAKPGTPIILYASAPTMAIVGTARLRAVHACDPDEAWQTHHRTFGLSRAEFDAYLNGSNWAYLLLLTQVGPLDTPLPLHHLRQDGPFHPPQSFRYVAATDPASIRELVPT